ncbi:MAG: hypothetical protein P4L81_01485 [Candidatus Pacebacteria bacterium]|nr:hypothetical protein [Candidatus Paceibacterota bacterium]
MKLLVVSHADTETEALRAADFVNSANGKAVYLGAHKRDLLVSLDAIRETLAKVDALVVMQGKASGKSNGREESELQRVERLAIHEAYEIGKLVGLIGNWNSLLSRHLIKSCKYIHLVGLYRDKMDESGVAGEHFHFAQFMPLNDFGRDGRMFIERLFSLPRKSAA